MSKKNLLIGVLLLFVIGAVTARPPEKYIDLYNKKLQDIEDKLDDIEGAQSHQIRSIITSYESVKKKIEGVKDDVRDHADYPDLVERMMDLEKEIEDLETYTRISSYIDDYNDELEKWEVGKYYSTTPAGWLNSIKANMVEGISIHYMVTVVDGTYSLGELIKKVQPMVENNEATKIYNAHEALKKKGDAGRLFRERGEPDFTNHYSNPQSSYILWVYNYLKGGFEYQDIYHLDPTTGKIIEQDLENQL